MDISKRFLLISLALLLSGNSMLLADDAPPTTDSATEASAQVLAPQTPTMTPEQLDTLVAPIALYPDPIISQIFVATTYPLEIVQAEQWLQANSSLQGKELTDAAAKQNWDPSIQALIIYPDVLKRLNQDITWTTNLGNAFLANQASVMDAVQRMRVKAEDAGKLKSTEQQKVVNTTDSGQTVVEIEPASPDVIYVPVYDPVWVWGPPAYYYYPGWYYPPRPAFGWCFWGPAISVGFYYGPGWGGWGGWGWRPGWYHHTVVVNNSFVVVHNYNVVHYNRVVGGTGVWQHNPEHRMGVAYPNRAVAQHYNPVARSVFNQPRPSVSQVQQRFQQSSARATAHPELYRSTTADRIGARRISPTTYNQNHTAYGGREQGANARMQSSRGYSSLSHRTAHAGGVKASGGGHSGGVSGGGTSGGFGGGGGGGGHGH